MTCPIWCSEAQVPGDCRVVPAEDLGPHPYQACCSYALFAARASDAQLSGGVNVPVVVRSIPGLPARCGTRVARPARRSVVRTCRRQLACKARPALGDHLPRGQGHRPAAAIEEALAADDPGQVVGAEWRRGGGELGQEALHKASTNSSVTRLAASTSMLMCGLYLTGLSALHPGLGPPLGNRPHRALTQLRVQCSRMGLRCTGVQSGIWRIAGRPWLAGWITDDAAGRWPP
jgi:hypothetical protein